MLGIELRLDADLPDGSDGCIMVQRSLDSIGLVLVVPSVTPDYLSFGGLLVNVGCSVRHIIRISDRSFSPSSDGQHLPAVFSYAVTGKLAY